MCNKSICNCTTFRGPLPYISPSGSIPPGVLVSCAHHVPKSRNVSRLFAPVATCRPIRDEQKLSWPGLKNRYGTECVERRVGVVPQKVRSCNAISTSFAILTSPVLSPWRSTQQRGARICARSATSDKYENCSHSIPNRCFRENGVQMTSIFA